MHHTENRNVKKKENQFEQFTLHRSGLSVCLLLFDSADQSVWIQWFFFFIWERCFRLFLTELYFILLTEAAALMSDPALLSCEAPECLGLIWIHFCSNYAYKHVIRTAHYFTQQRFFFFFTFPHSYLYTVDLKA